MYTYVIDISATGICLNGDKLNQNNNNENNSNINKDGFTPIHLASGIGGNVSIVKLFV